MNENRFSRLSIAQTSGSPAVAWTAREVEAAAATITRRTESALKKRGPGRAPTQARPLLSTFEIAWNCQPGSMALLSLLFDAIADADRYEAIPGGFQWTIGNDRPPVRHSLMLAGVDGLTQTARNAVLSELILSLERTGALKAETTWIPLSLAAAEDLELTAAEVSPLLSHSGFSVSIDGTPVNAFGLSIGFQREIEAAGLNDAGDATAFSGRMVPDIAGRLVCRIPTADFHFSLTNSIEAALLVEFSGDGWTGQIELPTVTLQANRRSLVGPENYEYALEFAAVDSDNAGTTALLSLTNV